MTYPRKDGTTLYQHQVQLEKQTGYRDERLDLIVPPPLLAHFAEWFADLTRARPSGYSATEPMSCQEIEAWMRVSDTPLRSYEVQILRDMDQAYRDESRRQEALLDG